MITVSFGVKAIFGRALRRIPLFGLADGLISGLIAMHNEAPTSSPEQPPRTLFRKNSPTCFLSEAQSVEVDLLVVGSGPGGSITAQRARSKGLKVLVVEAGSPVDASVAHHGPEQMMKFFRFGGQQMIISMPPIPFAQGFGLGGGSEINSGLYHRLPRDVESSWIKQLGVSESDWEEGVERVEDNIPILRQPEDSLGPYVSSPILDFGRVLQWQGDLVPRWRSYIKEEFKHFGMSETYLKEFKTSGGNILPNHRVDKLSDKGSSILVSVRGSSCSHKIIASRVCLAAGTVSTPEILWSSKLARPKEFSFGFHAMIRCVAKFDRAVNNLEDIDPHQVWSKNVDMKIGAAVATPALLRATMATKGIADELDMSKVAVYYISIDSSGRSGLIPIGKGLFPYFLPNKDMKSQIDLAAKTLYKAIYSAGGQILGDRNPTVSTVHVFGSLPIGKSPVVDNQGMVRGTQGRIFVRDASLLPSHPRVNPQGPLMHLIETLEGYQPALQESEQ